MTGKQIRKGRERTPAWFRRPAYVKHPIERSRSLESPVILLAVFLGETLRFSACSTSLSTEFGFLRAKYWELRLGQSLGYDKIRFSVLESNQQNTAHKNSMLFQGGRVMPNGKKHLKRWEILRNRRNALSCFLELIRNWNKIRKRTNFRSVNSEVLGPTFWKAIWKMMTYAIRLGKTWRTLKNQNWQKCEDTKLQQGWFLPSIRWRQASFK